MNRTASAWDPGAWPWILPLRPWMTRTRIPMGSRGNAPAGPFSLLPDAVTCESGVPAQAAARSTSLRRVPHAAPDGERSNDHSSQSSAHISSRAAEFGTFLGKRLVQDLHRRAGQNTANVGAALAPGQPGQALQDRVSPRSPFSQPYGDADAPAWLAGPPLPSMPPATVPLFHRLSSLERWGYDETVE
jgi:hypothetical protein